MVQQPWLPLLFPWHTLADTLHRESMVIITHEHSARLWGSFPPMFMHQCLSEAICSWLLWIGNSLGLFWCCSALETEKWDNWDNETYWFKSQYDLMMLKTSIYIMIWMWNVYSMTKTTVLSAYCGSDMLPLIVKWILSVLLKGRKMRIRSISINLFGANKLGCKV